MFFDESVSQEKVQLTLEEAGYTYGTDSYNEELRRCFAPDGAGHFLEKVAVIPLQSRVRQQKHNSEVYVSAA